jgi:two-component system cell cycle response regulator
LTARLLVVDDDAANARLLEVALAAEYYEVRTVTDGADTVASVTAWEPDVILLDVKMPRMNGYQVCQALKADEQTKHIPVIMVTGLKEPADRRHGLACGADEFLTKPIEHQILIARLRGIIRLKRVLDETRARHTTMAALGLGDARAQAAAPAATTPARALVIDDLAARARRLHAILTDAGIETAIIHDAPSQDLDEADHVDLIIISLSLSDADPLRLLARFQSAAATRDTPLLLIAEPEQTATVIAGLNLGASDCVMLPLDDVEFLLRAKNLIRRKRHQDSLRDDVSNALALAVIDPLTKLHNRRYLTSHLERLCADPEHPGFAILMIDVDHFKTINDRFGHAVGDTVLQAIAAILHENLRKSDFISRFGGEEFITIIDALTDERRALAVAEKIRGAIETIRIRPGLHLSVSIGIAMRDCGEEISAACLIDQADQAMYDAKRRGRNTVSLYQPPRNPVRSAAVS